MPGPVLGSSALGAFASATYVGSRSLSLPLAAPLAVACVADGGAPCAGALVPAGADVPQAASSAAAPVMPSPARKPRRLSPPQVDDRKRSPLVEVRIAPA